MVVFSEPFPPAVAAVAAKVLSEERVVSADNIYEIMRHDRRFLFSHRQKKIPGAQTPGIEGEKTRGGLFAVAEAGTAFAAATKPTRFATGTTATAAKTAAFAARTTATAKTAAFATRKFAALTAAITATTTASAVTAAAVAGAAFLTRTGFVNFKGTTLERVSLELLDGGLGFFRRGHGHEGEPTGAACELVVDHGNLFDFAGLAEEIADCFFGDAEDDISDEQFITHLCILS